MPVPVFNDPELCYRRADEARQLASDVVDRELRELMVELAEEYEEMGREAEGRSSGR
jgi:hypothetical protein